MHAASLDRSARLRRAHALLSDGREHSTRDLREGAHIEAVSATVAELRAAGAEIECRQSVTPAGSRIWLYRMTKPAVTSSPAEAQGVRCSGCNRLLSFVCPLTGLCQDCEAREGEEVDAESQPRSADQAPRQLSLF